MGRHAKHVAVRGGGWSTACCLALLAALAVPAAARAQSRAGESDRTLAREILRELIEIDTSEPGGGTRAAAEALAARLAGAGFAAADVQVLGPEPHLGNLVARLRGTDPGLPPLLLMAHIDVVPALSRDWTVEPFALVERDGYYYGRGTTDNKAGAAVLITNLIRYRRDGWRGERDVLVVLTADEETTGASIQWLLAEHPDVRRAGLALNTDAGGGTLFDGRYGRHTVQAAEKVYLSYRLEVRNPGGHSSQPRRDNAVYQLAHGLVRLAGHRFPVRLTEVARLYFERSAALGGADTAAMRRIAADPADTGAIARLSATPYYDALLRTTCVATQLDAGHAENALPQTAQAVVNCRILPGEDPDEVDVVLRQVLADDAIQVGRIREPTLSPPSPLTREIMGILEGLTERHFPGAVVVPGMSTGATDGLYVRNAGIPVYGVAAIFEDASEDPRAHGRDERVLARSFYEALDFWYDLVRAFGGRR
jgi:acetylornithine deacetylase/succinyl-diaminopimelate desuccinylase-like protein